MAASAPHPASGPFNYSAEGVVLKRELLENYEEYATVREVAVEVCAGGEWPASVRSLGMI